MQRLRISPQALERPAPVGRALALPRAKRWLCNLAQRLRCEGNARFNGVSFNGMIQRGPPCN